MGLIGKDVVVRVDSSAALFGELSIFSGLEISDYGSVLGLHLGDTSPLFRDVAVLQYSAFHS
jgi:hypothetical protein